MENEKDPKKKEEKQGKMGQKVRLLHLIDIFLNKNRRLPRFNCKRIGWRVGKAWLSGGTAMHR